MGAPQSAARPRESESSGTKLSSMGEDGYEYEYDANETEDYYFTLDLTTHSRRRNQFDGRNADHEFAPETSALAPNEASDPSQSGATKPESKLQVLDLHSDNPLIKLNNDLYSCEWSTDLGTQVYVTRPGVAENPKRSGNVLDVVGLSRVRLIGRPAKLRRQQQQQQQQGEDISTELSGSSATHAISIDEVDTVPTEDVLSEARDAGALSVNRQIARFAAVRQSSKNAAQREQASFLERLSSIKQDRGETDLIPFYGVKQYILPENKDEIRESARLANPVLVVSSDTAPKTAAPKKKRKRKVSVVDTSGEASKGPAAQSTGSEPSHIPRDEDGVENQSSRGEWSTTVAEQLYTTGALPGTHDRTTRLAIDPLLLMGIVEKQNQTGDNAATGGASEPP